TLVITNQALAMGETSTGQQVVDDSDDPNDPTNTDNDGDGDPDDPTVVVIEWGVAAAAFEIFNGVTPNGDGLNDFFEIRGIVDYPQNNVKIFNRWGVLVFETDGYNESDNVFRGVSNGRATVNQDKELPTGTYYYILTFTGSDTPEGRSAYNGYLYINR
ncbi:MAG: gliding motility-associated C-terminal domain-containing protein, partial [Bacteroidota bacterium]